MLLVTGCSTGVSYAPVDSDGYMKPPEGYYRVKSGDTLYSIAWNYNLDYRQLAASNHITPPYALNEGQLVHIVVEPETEPLAIGGLRQKTPNPPYGIKSSNITPPIAERIVAEKKEIAKPPSPPPVAVNSPNPLSNIVKEKETTKPVPVKPVVVVAEKQQSSSTAVDLAPPKVTATVTGGTNVGLTSWRWPVEGTVITSFAPEKGNKGIDITADRGTPVVATSGGVVVYCGNGLSGYGNLIILKHNADFLSAYAHTEKMFVKEGQKVLAGQKIALMGDTGSDKVKLHFEIRRQGTPVDPAKYLPTH